MPKISKVQAPRPASSRPGNVKQPREEVSQFICTRCGKIYRRQKDNFSASYSPLYRGNGGYLPVCKHCIDDLYDHYKEVLESEEKAIRRICTKFDIYWNRKVFDMVWRGNTSASRMRNYLSRCNLNAYVNKTYDDTLDEEAAVGEAETVLTQDMIDEAVAAARAEMQAEFDAAMKAAQETVQLTADGDVERGTIEKEELPLPEPDIVKFWGSGLSADYYYALQERFDKWTANQPKPLEPATEALYKQVCICEEQVHRGLISGQSIERPQSMLNTLLGSLNEKPTQKKQEEALDADFEKMTFGQGIKAFENLRPVPKPDPIFKDVDGIVRYITIWFRPIDHVHRKVFAKYNLSNCWEPLKPVAPKHQSEQLYVPRRRKQKKVTGWRMVKSYPLSQWAISSQAANSGRFNDYLNNESRLKRAEVVGIPYGMMI